MGDDINSGAPDVKIIPPLVYLTGLVIGLLVNIWIPIKAVPNSVAWVLGGILIICGAVLPGSALCRAFLILCQWSCANRHALIRMIMIARPSRFGSWSLEKAATEEMTVLDALLD
jgi:hypothetical protein